MFRLQMRLKVAFSFSFIITIVKIAEKCWFLPAFQSFVATQRRLMSVYFMTKVTLIS